MPTSAIDSLLFRDIFGSAAMRDVWSDTFRNLDWEAAPARAEAKLGLIPKEAADEITRVCKVENIDFEAYEKETLTIGRYRYSSRNLCRDSSWHDSESRGGATFASANAGTRDAQRVASEYTCAAGAWPARAAAH